MAWLEIEYLNLKNGRIQGHTTFIANDAAFIELMERLDTNAENVRTLRISGKEMEPEPFINMFMERA